MLRKNATFLLAIILSLVMAVPVAAAAPAATGTSVAGGDVSGTWDVAGSPYLINGNITVPAGATLTIDAGVQVLFQSWYMLTVNGTLLANGTESAPILFGGGHPTAGWLGIRFINAPDGSSLVYATIENGGATGASPLDSGGGIYSDHSNPVIRHSTIRNNHAGYSGGGIYLTSSNATLIANTIIDNTAGSNGASANGGGVTILNSNPIVEDNIISGNSVSIAGSYSTPSGFGGGLYVQNSNSTFSGNLISDNHVNAQLNSNARGAGLYLSSGAPNFVNDTISGNTIENESSGYYAVKEGGGIYSYLSNPTFVNTALWNDAPQEIFVSQNGYRSTLTFAYTDLQGGQAGLVTNNSATVNWEAGNLDSAPRFVDAASADFSLQSNSPLVDAGTANFSWNGTTLVDLTSADYSGNAPDIGAFESAYSGGGSGGGSNQPPVAAVSANPESGNAPLPVQFSSDGSNDPDGQITAYAWDFGDGSTSNDANPAHTYTSTGTFDAVLVVSDNDNATSSATVTIHVTQASQNEIHVQVQNLARTQSSSRVWKGTDTVLVTDQNNQPVAGVKVTATYSGPNRGQVSGTTAADGKVTLTTSSQRNPRGSWCFSITALSKGGYTYDPGSNVVTSLCE